MPHRLAIAAWAAPALAWAMLGLAAASEGSASCATNDPASGAALVLMALGAASALAGLVLNVWPFRAGWDLGVFGGGIAVVVLGFIAIGFGVVALLGVVLLYGIWRIATSDARRAARARALLAYVASSLWFPAAGIALLWVALRCFTF
jgi:hypothetical protein